MRIVIAPDKFKGSLSAPEVARHLSVGLLRVIPGLDILEVPVADGGEGTVDAAVAAGYERRLFTVTGPTGEPVSAAIAVREHQAVVEMAAASGLAVLPGGVLDARGASSVGTGRLIAAALDLGCTDIVLGVGGSASTDGGAGLLVGLGARMLDESGTVLAPGGAALAQLARIDLSGLDPRLPAAKFVLASDVDNGLLGAGGAAAVFGPQKGASADDVRDLDAALDRFVQVLGREIGQAAVDAASSPGAGAAGGAGYAAMVLLGATRRPGVDVVLEFTGFTDSLQGASLVLTGEGSLDEQTLLGKTPVGVARAAAAAAIPVLAVCGRSLLTADELRAAGFDRTYALTDLEQDVAKCMTDAGPLVERVGELVGAYLQALAPVGPSI
ncbi:glycerate kinase [Arthrobacter sp. H41]|uniref:glycerate kinase n=1 Tax=Arthrobacter sp. H41 TaxID=1312978 RepID=UPI0004799574|nr:glycerate kinase [Arthrobacter sp. H41]